MPLIKDKIYVYVNTFVTGSIGHTPGQEFKCIDPENKVFEPPISDLGYINFYDEISDTNFFVSDIEIQEKESLQEIIDFFILNQKYEFPKIIEFLDLNNKVVCHTINRHDKNYEQYIFEKIVYENKIPKFIFFDLNQKEYCLSLYEIRILYLDKIIKKI